MKSVIDISKLHQNNYLLTGNEVGYRQTDVSKLYQCQNHLLIFIVYQNGGFLTISEQSYRPGTGLLSQRGLL